MPKRRNAGAKRNPAASRSMKARTTPRRRGASPDRLRERSNFGYTDSAGYNYEAYSKPDLKSLNAKARNPEHVVSPRARGGDGSSTSPHLIPKRQMTSDDLRNPRIQAKRRKLSTESALRRADASMFNYDD